MNTFGKNVKRIRIEKGISQDELARRAGYTSRSTISCIESGKRDCPQKQILLIANALGVTPGELLESKEDSNDKQEKTNISQIFPSDKIYKIPVFASVSAGFGAYAEENVIDFLPIVIENPYDVPDMLGIQVHGNSMYPKIEDGDIIVVRKQESVDSGDIAVVMIDGEEAVVKKVLYGDDWIELHSINPEYMPRRFEGAEVERLRVVGLVKGTFKMFR